MKLSEAFEVFSELWSLNFSQASKFQNAVGNAAHRGDNDGKVASFRAGLPDQPGDVDDAFRGTDRGSSEFMNDPIWICHGAFLKFDIRLKQLSAGSLCMSATKVAILRQDIPTLLSESNSGNSRKSM